MLTRCKNPTYQERLKRLNIPSLELPRLHADLILTYKILFAHLHLDVNLFEFGSTLSTRGHQYKLYKHHTNHCIHSSFFCERIINVWNSLPSSVNFRSINSFKQSISSVDFTAFLKCVYLYTRSHFLRAAVSVVLTLPFLFVNCNFLYVNFSMSMDKLNDDDDDDDEVWHVSVLQQ